MPHEPERPDILPLAAPPEDFRPGAYWFWGAIPTSGQMRAQLRDFRDRGFGTILIQARLSMPRALYLSDAFLAAYREACTIMAELGLSAMIYDDYNWTSGQAGGRSVVGADHLREAHLFWAGSAVAEARISGIEAVLAASLGPAARDWLFEGGSPRFADWTLASAVLIHSDGRAEDVSARADLIRGEATGCTVRLSGPVPEGARWFAFAHARCANSRLINYLMPEAGARFVEVGLEPYARALRGLIPAPVTSLFFDQPAPGLYRWAEREGNLISSLPWSDGFAARLRAQGPLWQALAALVCDAETAGDAAAETAAEARAALLRCHAATMHEAFFAPLRAFADRTGLRLTGHEILAHVGSFALNGGFSAIDPRVALGSDFFGLDGFRDETAVDANNLGAQLAPVLGHALARRAGRRGCVTELYITAERCETRAAGQWEMTPADLRKAMIRLHLLGSRQVILHALFAEEGNETPDPLRNMRFDFAPGYNLEPWWPVMGAITAEAARLAAFIAGAVVPPAGPVLFYPLETALREGPRHAHATTFGAWAEALVARGAVPHVTDEAGVLRLSRARQLDGGRLTALILPAVTAFADPAVAEHLAALETAGLPVWSVAGDSVAGELLDRLDALGDGYAVDPVAGLRMRDCGTDAEGARRIVLFNETDETVPVRLRWPGGEAAFPLPAGALLCLRPGHDPMPLPPTETPPTETLVTETRSLRDGWSLAPGGAPARPVSVETGWQAQGLPAFSGTGQYACGFHLETAMRARLALPGVAVMARVEIDGRDSGTLFHPPWDLDLGTLAAGDHRLVIEVTNTAANRFYAGTPYAGALWPDRSGLTAPPLLHLTPFKSES